MSDIPAPLDAYETAKDGEPTWTVQGGDPLGAPLLRIWAHFARIRAGAIPERGLERIFEEIMNRVNANRPEEEQPRNDLLLRATLTEDLSFDMDAYLNGNVIEQDVVKQTAMRRMDIYDTRRNCARRISNFFSELNDYREQLGELGYMFEALDCAMFMAVEQLRIIEKIVSIRRDK